MSLRGVLKERKQEHKSWRSIPHQTTSSTFDSWQQCHSVDFPITIFQPPVPCTGVQSIGSSTLSSIINSQPISQRPSHHLLTKLASLVQTAPVSCLQSPLPTAFKRTTFSFLDRSGREGPTQRCDMPVLSARSSLLPQLKCMSLLSKYDLSRLFHSKVSFPRTPQQFNTPARDAGAICGFKFSETGAVAPHFLRHALLTTAFRRTRTVI